MIIQIYSMTTVADAIATAEAGADFIGVVAGEPGIVAEAEAHQETADYLMLESGAKGVPFAGGETHDWLVSRLIVERSRIPVILAGGLSPENVGQAIATVRPWGVDSFTHTDIAGQRGRKDPLRVRSFVANALRAFAEMVESDQR